MTGKQNIKRAGTKKRKKPTRARWYENRKMILVLLAAITMLVYGQTTRFGFTWFDDDAILLRNQAYVSDLSNLTDAIFRDAEFTQQNIELYRPLQNVTFMLDAAIGGFDGGMFHFTNVLLHLASVFLLFFLLELLGFSRLPSALGAALLAVHPVFTFAVCWIPARGDLLLAFWSLAAFYLFVLFLKTNRIRYLWWNLLAFTMALFSKETAVMLVPLCVLWYMMTKPERFWQRWQWIPVVGYSAVLTLYMYLRYHAIYHVEGDAFGLMPFLHNLRVLPETLLRFFVPWPMPALPFYTLAVTLGGVLVVALMVVFVVRKRAWNPLVITGIAWFLLYNLPSMFYRPDWSDYIYDYIIHRSYLPLTGVIVLILALFRQYHETLKQKKPQLVVATVLLVLMVLSFSFARIFRAPLPFWQYAVQANPASSFVHKYYGGALFFEERYQDAIRSYTRSLELNPDFTEARLNRGIALAAAGNHREALEDFNHYLDSVPADTMILRYRVISLMELKDYQEAIPSLVSLRESGDRTERIHYSLAVCYLLTGQYAKAKETMDELLLRNPTRTAYLRTAALADMGAGYPAQAIDRYLRVLTEDPSANTLSNLGYAYWENGMHREALQHFERAAALQPDNFSINVGLMLSHHALGNPGGMRNARDKALEIKPDIDVGEEALEQLREEGYVFTDAQWAVMQKLFQR